MSTRHLSDQKTYQDFVKGHRPPRLVFLHSVRAFLVGGSICLLGQGVQSLFVRYANFSIKDAGNPTVAVMIILSVIFTSLGVYDKFANWAGAGSAVPVTGFANTMASAALEYKRDGWIGGVGSNMFKLAGPVVVYGVVAAFFVALIRYLILHL